jgi:YHS domain-containing protein
MKTRVPSLLITLAFLAVCHAAEPANCPISGEPADPEIKLTVNGKDVGLCCNGCSKVYEQKLNVTDKGPGKCPISGQAASAEHRQLHAVSQVVYFCCDNCPKAFADKQKFKSNNEAPDKCPVTGNAAQPASFVLHNGEKVYFCCDNCPSAFIKRLNAKDPGPGKCPVSGRPAVAASKMIVTKTDAVYFCCNNCPKSYAEKHFTAKQ